MWNKIKNCLARIYTAITMSEEERWLASSHDIVELERRLQTLRSTNWNAKFRI